MLSCSIWFSAPSFWMGGGLESRCVGRVYGADGAVRRHQSALIFAGHYNTCYKSVLRSCGWAKNCPKRIELI